MSRKLICTLLVAVCSLCFATIAQADIMVLGDAVPLDVLIADGQLVVEDKTFTNFTYAATGNMPPAASVNVIPIVDVTGPGPLDLWYGIRFQGGFIDLPGGGASDSLITFTVTVTDPDRLISDVHLAGNPAVLGGAGFAGVNETFEGLDDVELNIFSSSELNLSDWVDLDEEDWATSLNVRKDILLEAGDGLSATISFIDQTFSQVPEPATLSLLGLAGLVLLGFRRKL